jgi:hypothetical protein
LALATLRAIHGTSLAALLLLLACANSDAVRSEALVREENRLSTALASTPAPALEAAELRVRLAFDSAVDLDLYVTDPSQETVYFANNPSRSGGRLDADVRCDAATPRIETVRFRSAPAGRYRVGVDYPESCDGKRARTPFVLVLEHGRVRREQRGAVDWHRFLPIVLEEDVQSE